MEREGKLPLMESFYSIQGEGFHQGRAAYFIRLAGCDVGCVWCDVKDSWATEDYPWLEAMELADLSTPYNSEIVIVTGGEPLMYDLDALTSAIKRSGKHPHLETSGAYPLSGNWDWICFSPKKFKAPHDEFFEKAHELKVVIYHRSDLEWATELGKKMHKGARLFLQPEWSKSDEVMPLVIEFIKQHPHWEISLQIHKFMNIP